MQWSVKWLFFFTTLATKDVIEKPQNAFGASRSSVSILIRKVAKIIVEHLGPKLIKLPKAVPEVGALVENFLNEHGFPLRLGAIDVTHRRIKQPREYYTDYINRKGFRSINVITDIAF